MTGFSIVIATLGMFFIIFLMMLPFIIAYFVGLWATFKKCGKKGWYSIVPFYNTWILNEIAELDWWYAIIIIFPATFIIKNDDIVGLFNLAKAIVNFFICYNIGKKFNKGIGTTILLFFFPFIMYPIIGFSKNFKYNKDIIVSKNGPIDLNNSNNIYNQNNNTSNFVNNNSSNYNQNNNSSNFVNNSSSNFINNNSNDVVNNNLNNSSIEKRYCSRCGNTINNNDKFCRNCGNRTYN